MLKRLPLSLVATFLMFAAYGQTIVSTSPENKNVILEEYTGIHCTWCPSGHVIAKAIQDAHPDDVSIINIHQGGFANPSPGEPDFRTPYGDAIVAQSYSGSGFGYPSGSVNRTEFPGRSMASGGGTAMGRNNWTVSANESLALPSNVNVAVEAEIDVQTNEIVVHVEAYYTANSSESTNLLNVALLQNNTKGPQTGGGMGDEYNHMHRLVELITGQWGETLNTTTSGTFVDKTYTYPIPTDYNGVLVEISELEVVAFITETQQVIPSGSRTYPTYTGLTNVNDANVRFVEAIPDNCSGNLAPSVNIQNFGQDPITSLDISYAVNGGTASVHNWTGNLTSLQSETIELPEIAFDLQGSNEVIITVPNDDDNSNNEVSSTFDEAVGGAGTVTMELNTDGYGSEVRWNLKDGTGAAVASGGPYGNNQTITITWDLDLDCYSFTIIDTYGDGGGAVTLSDQNGVELYYTNGSYGGGETSFFSSDGVLGVGESTLSSVSLYPNPATDILNLRNAENADIAVYDVLGKLIMSQTNISMDQEINVAKLTVGTYFMKISKDNQVTTKRFVIAQ